MERGVRMDECITGKELANSVSRFVNVFTPDTKGFTEAILNDHPTLQQSTIRLCFELIHAMSRQKYMDQRNEKSVSTCKLIIKLCGDEMGLPFI